MKKCLFYALALSCFSASLFAQTARVKVLHNSADPAADTLDVWLDNTLLLDNLAFRTSSAFVNAPAGSFITIGIAPKGSTQASEALEQFVMTLTENETYIIAASGNLGSGFNPATPFTLETHAAAREVATNAANTDILVLHGCTDAPTVDLRSQDLLTTHIDDISYPQFSAYWEQSTANMVLALTDASGTLVERYSANLSSLSLTGAAVTVVASGFMTPADNNNGASFGLWLATAGAGNMTELPIFVPASIIDIRAAELGLRLFPMPANSQLNAEFALPAASATNLLIISDLSGRVVRQQMLGALEAGTHTLQLPLGELANGQYILQLSSSAGRQTLPLSVLR